MKNSWDKVVDSTTSEGLSRRSRTGRERLMSLAGVAVLSVSLAACAESSDVLAGDSSAAPTESAQPAPEVTDAAEPTESAEPEVTDAAEPVESAEPETEEASPDSAQAEASFVDINGRWCPSSPSGSEACIEIQLPVVEYDGGDIDTQYVYPFPTSADDVVDDPRDLSEADYDTAPDHGECWNAIMDGFPSGSGAQMNFCPLGAVADDPAIDDPTYWESEDGAFDGAVPDYRGTDRLYIGQDLSPFPYVRDDG